MTTHDKDKIIAAAKDACFTEKQWRALTYDSGPYEITTPCNSLTNFYAIAFEDGRQAEREECAKVCESTYPEYGGANPYCFETPSECAEAIRARGDSK